MGRDLSALGINMYFGPSLDVLENPNPTLNNDLGTSVFGGDPYWVSVLGSAYIMGCMRVPRIGCWWWQSTFRDEAARTGRMSWKWRPSASRWRN